MPMTRRGFLGMMGVLPLPPAVAMTAAIKREFHQIRLQDLPTTTHTHAEVIGTVARVLHEADGDIHVRLTDGAAFCIVEIIPELPLPIPMKGQRIRVRGITRRDPLHRWFELHPCLGWDAL